MGLVCRGIWGVPAELTLPEHPCYGPHRSNTNLTISRRNQKPREAHPYPPEDSTPKPIPTAHTRGPRLKQPAPSPQVPCTLSLVIRRWKMPGRRHSGPAIPRREPCLGGPNLAYIKQGVADRLFDRDSLSEVGPPASLRQYQARGRRAARPSGGPHNMISEGATARSLAPTMPAGIQGGVTAGLSPRKVRVYHRALGVAGLPCLGAAQHPPAKRGKADRPTSSIANHPDRTIKTPPPTGV